MPKTKKNKGKHSGTGAEAEGMKGVDYKTHTTPVPHSGDGKHPKLIGPNKAGR